MTFRRRPAEPGRRHRAGTDFVSGRCAVCAEWYLLNVQTQPWARARTCSETCAKRLANRDRKPENCQHCAVWQGYRDERLRQEIAWDNGFNPDGSAGGFRDEDVRLIGSREWMEHAQGWGEPSE